MRSASIGTVTSIARNGSSAKPVGEGDMFALRSVEDAHSGQNASAPNENGRNVSCRLYILNIAGGKTSIEQKITGP